MQVEELFGKLAFSKEKLVKIPVFSTPRLLTDLYCLEPGQEQKPHVHADSDKVYVVLEGQAKIRVGSEERLVTSGQAVLAPAGDSHGIANAAQAERLICMVLVTPPPPHKP